MAMVMVGDAPSNPASPAAEAGGAAGADDLVWHRAALQVELFAHGAHVLTQVCETCPKNTNRQYDPKQKEWRDFCAEKGFEDGELVYENKLVWFLNERVLEREIRPSRYKKKKRRATCMVADGADGGSGPIRQTLGISAVKAYIAAIVDLWSFQKSQGINPHPTPRRKP